MAESGSFLGSQLYSYGEAVAEEIGVHPMLIWLSRKQKTPRGPCGLRGVGCIRYKPHRLNPATERGGDSYL